jgi:hypothetical protein
VSDAEARVLAVRLAAAVRQAGPLTAEQLALLTAELRRIA